MRLGSAERAALVAGARGLDLELSGAQLDQLDTYMALVGRWSATTSLISCRSATEMVDRHLLDSLTVVAHRAGAATAVDLGSGAGLPGVPLAVACPDLRITLLEPRRRRASFLRTVRRELRLANVTIREARAEDPIASPNDVVDLALCRAVWSDETRLLVAGARWVRPGGRLLWMRGASELEVGDSAEGPFRRRRFIPTVESRGIAVYERLSA